jgi:hypothetical protein
VIFAKEYVIFQKKILSSHGMYAEITSLHETFLSHRNCCSNFVKHELKGSPPDMTDIVPNDLIDVTNILANDHHRCDRHIAWNVKFIECSHTILQEKPIHS